MTPIQQLMLGVGASQKTYIDEVFSNYIWKGDGAATQTINNGIDMSGEGGLTWIKRKSSTRNHALFDTLRGAGKRISSNVEAVTSTTYTDELKSFTSTGFTVGNSGNTGNNGQDYSSWSFRKSKGFFDCVTYTGNGTTGQYISHNLGCEVGCIIIKCTSAETGWQVYHISSEIADEHSQGHGSDDYELMLSSTSAASQQTQWLSTTASPTASNFHLNKDAWSNNKNGETYVAYIFAAGRSSAATARCTQFDGSNDELTISDHADFELGSGDFTIETWIKSNQPTNSYRTAVAKWVDSGNNRSWNIRYCSQDIGVGWVFFYSLDGSSYSGANGGTLLGGDVGDGKWHHIAVTRTGGNIRTFTDGVLNNTVSESGTLYDGTGDVTIGGQGGNYFRGQLSNVRLIKGTALYTSGFTPPTEPLTDVTNTKLLCCNNLSVTGSTVTPGTISKNSSPASIPESPFKDSAAEKFGDSKGNIIHCGSYIGGGNTRQNIDLGWEPQWLLIKDTTSASNWILYDSLRGLTGKDVSDKTLFPNTDDAEVSDEYFNVQPWGFRVTSNDNEVNKSWGRFVFIAIRRPDGYVSKPATAGTDVFTVDASNGSTTPAFDSGFPVDFALIKDKSSTSTFWAVSRLRGRRGLYTNSGVSEASHSELDEFDHSAAHGNYEWWDNTNVMSWMWKRHAGFDVVQYRCLENIDTGVQMISHSMNAVPEMYWVKNRGTTSTDWAVYHKGLNGGTNPHNYYLKLNSDGGEGSDSSYFGAAPTKTAFAVNRSNTLTGHHDHKFVAYLFSSVAGISKVGSYTGNGSTSGPTITTGFQPRFLILKRRQPTGQWAVFDTVRGLTSSGSNGDYLIYLNQNQAQSEGTYIDLSSTGFTIKSTWAGINSTSNDYIYYAHA